MANIKRLIPLLLSLLMCATAAGMEKKDTTNVETKRRIRLGYDGGMMLHTGYLWGEISPIGYNAHGMPLGIGGAIRLHVGKHFRIGTEGYTSTIKQMGNGSTVKYGWGGLLMDCRFETGRLMPYAGITVGGGGTTKTLMFEGDSHDWEKEESIIFHKERFLAIAPFVGTDIIITSRFHLTIKVDWLCAISGGSLLMPTGPRLYFGFLMYH